MKIKVKMKVEPKGQKSVDEKKVKGTDSFVDVDVRVLEEDLCDLSVS